MKFHFVGILAILFFSRMQAEEISTSIVFISPQMAELKIQKIWHGYEADGIRKRVEESGLKEFTEEALEVIQKQYNGAKETAPVTIEDDNNRIMATYTYQIPSRARPGKRFITVGSMAHQRGWKDHPLWIKEHIHVENPFNHWDLDTEEFDKIDASFEYHYAMKKEGTAADFYYELKLLSDHAPAELRDVESHASHELHIAPAGLPPKP